MLEELHALDWARLTHAYGPASEVPQQLRGLASDSPKARQEALATLFGTIWHQGTIYPASPHAIPFLIEILGAPEARDRAPLLGLLIALARGESSRAHVRVATREAFALGSALYASLLESRNPDERARAAQALEALAEVRPQTKPSSVRALRARFGRERLDSVRASLAFTLGALGSEAKPATSIASSPARSRLVRVAASLGGARTGRLRPEGLQLLVDALSSGDVMAEAYDRLPQREDGLLDDACAALRKLGRSAAPALVSLLEVLPGVAAINTSPVIEAILSITFRLSPVPRSLGSLRPDQRRVLEAIRSCDNVWRARTEALVRASLLKGCGLPPDRDALAAFLSPGPQR